MTVQMLGFVTAPEPEMDPSPPAAPAAPEPVATIGFFATPTPVEEPPKPPAPAVGAPAARSDLFVNDSSQLGWEALRDYVVRAIEERWGKWPRDPVVEASIFRSFIGRWGSRSMEIAEYVVLNGCTWMGAPLSVKRFTKASDERFARAILEQIDAGQR